MTLPGRMKLNPRGATACAKDSRSTRLSHVQPLRDWGSNGGNSVGHNMPPPRLCSHVDSHLAGGRSHDPGMANLVAVLARDDWVRGQRGRRAVWAGPPSHSSIARLNGMAWRESDSTLMSRPTWHASPYLTSSYPALQRPRA